MVTMSSAALLSRNGFAQTILPPAAPIGERPESWQPLHHWPAVALGLSEGPTEALRAPRVVGVNPGVTSGPGNNKAGGHSMAGGIQAQTFYGQGGTGQQQPQTPREQRSCTDATGTLRPAGQPWAPPWTPPNAPWWGGWVPRE